MTHATKKITAGLAAFALVFCAGAYFPTAGTSG